MPVKPNPSQTTVRAEWEDVRAKVRAKLARTATTMSELARITRTDQSQIRRWIIDGDNEPRATIALRLKAWAEI